MDALKCGLESAHERYEKEIMLHSDSLNTIKDLKVSLEQVKEELSERKKINSELEERLSLVDKSAQEIRNRLEDDIKDLEKRFA